MSFCSLARARALLLVLTILAAGGCATLPTDWGATEVRDSVLERGRSTPPDRDALVAAIASRALSVEDAVALALVNNPALRVAYGQLGFAAMDLVTAGRLHNPLLSGSSLDDGGDRILSLGLVASIADVVTLASRRTVAEARHAEVRAQVAHAVLEIAADTERAFYRYAVAREREGLASRVARVASLSSELAGRYFEAGNLTPRELALERAAAAVAQLEAEGASARVAPARTDLALLLGLSASQPWRIVAELDLPQPLAYDLEEIKALATKNRLDLVAANDRVARLRHTRQMRGWQRFIGAFDLGIEREREPNGDRFVGPTLELELPLNSHPEEVGRADVAIAVAIAERDALLNSIDASVERAHAAIASASARIAIYRDELIPARREATRRAQEEANFMLIGTFELLRSREDEYRAATDYLDAVEAFWIERTALTRAVGTTLPMRSPRIPIGLDDLNDNGGTGGHHHHEEGEGE